MISTRTGTGMMPTRSSISFHHPAGQKPWGAAGTPGAADISEGGTVIGVGVAAAGIFMDLVSGKFGACSDARICGREPGRICTASIVGQLGDRFREFDHRLGRTKTSKAERECGQDEQVQ